MFFIFNKDKITAYVVTMLTVMVLFFTASVFNKTEKSVETSVREIKTNIVNETINNEFDKNEIENNIILNKN